MIERARCRSFPLWLLALPLVVGCASFGGRVVEPEGIEGEDPWVLPAGAFPTQRHYRVEYDGPQGDLGFKLTLYLIDARQYRMQAALGLGRKFWDLSIDANGWALWVDHRNQEYCQAREASSLEVVPIAHLPLSALPKLLLGRLPAVPAAELARLDGGISYRDAHGQLWSARFAASPTTAGSYDFQRLEWWSLAENGEPVVWWRSREGGGGFTDRRGQQQVRWVEVVREPLTEPPRPLTVPAGYREGDCGG